MNETSVLFYKKEISCIFISTTDTAFFLYSNSYCSMLKSSIFDIVKTMLRHVYEILKDILNVNI